VLLAREHGRENNASMPSSWSRLLARLSVTRVLCQTAFVSLSVRLAGGGGGGKDLPEPPCPHSLRQNLCTAHFEQIAGKVELDQGPAGAQQRLQQLALRARQRVLEASYCCAVACRRRPAPCSREV
jgi:hypothetical protein